MLTKLSDLTGPRRDGLRLSDLIELGYETYSQSARGVTYYRFSGEPYPASVCPIAAAYLAAGGDEEDLRNRPPCGVRCERPGERLGQFETVTYWANSFFPGDVVDEVTVMHDIADPKTGVRTHWTDIVAWLREREM